MLEEDGDAVVFEVGCELELADVEALHESPQRLTADEARRAGTDAEMSAARKGQMLRRTAVEPERVGILEDRLIAVRRQDAEGEATALRERDAPELGVSHHVAKHE